MEPVNRFKSTIAHQGGTFQEFSVFRSSQFGLFDDVQNVVQSVLQQNGGSRQLQVND